MAKKGIERCSKSLEGTVHPSLLEVELSSRDLVVAAGTTFYFR